MAAFVTILKGNILCWFLVFLLASTCCGYTRARDDRTLELTVAKGSNLSQIAGEYLGDSRKWRPLARINHLKNPDFVYAGQVLVIPVKLLKDLPFNGTVTFVQGEVKALDKRPAAWRSLQVGDTVAQGSRIRTDNESAAELTFDNGSSFFLKPNTELGLNLAQRKGAHHVMSDFFLDAGRTVVKIRGASGVDSRHKITTPSSTASVRGTEFRVAVDSSRSTFTEVLEGKVEISTRRKKMMVKEGEGTVVGKGRAPITPVRLLPAPVPIDLQTIYNSMPLQFRFEEVKGARAIKVILARDEAGKGVAAEGVLEGDGTFTVQNFDDGTYYLRSQSVSSLGLEGPLSGPSVIRVRTIPLPPITRTPSHGDVLVGKTVEIKWLKVKEAAHYHVQVAGDRTFETIIEEDGNYDRESYRTGKLEFGAYYFRVRSVAEDGYEGAWSDAVGFSLIPPLAAPAVDKPAVEGKTTCLRWRNLGEGITYHLQMAKAESFDQVIIDGKVGESAVEVDTPEEPAMYYVRISAIDSEGNEGDFSPPQTFEIKRGFPYAIIGGVLAAGLAILLVP